MKLFKHAENQRENATIRKAAQPMLQILESRRLMSLSGAAIEYPAPLPVSPEQVAHSFGFENHAAIPGGFNPDMHQPPMFGDGNLDQQFAIAIAQHAPIVLTDPSQLSLSGSIISGNAAVTTTATGASSPASAATPTSLSTLYGTLNNSTVNEIDAASTGTSTASAILDNSNSFAATAQSTVNLTRDATSIIAPMGVISVAHQSISTDAAAPAANDGLISPTVQLISVVPTPQAALPTDQMPVIHPLTQTVEAELATISALAREAISQLGRDMAIELAHLETNAVSMVEQMIAPWDGWRFAAVTGAAVASAAYLQSEMKTEKKKTGSVFSSHLIEVEPI